MASNQTIPIRWATEGIGSFQEMDKDFFKVGATIWFQGFGPPVEVVHIDEQQGFWVGSILGEISGNYPLDKAELVHWTNHFLPGKGRTT